MGVGMKHEIKEGGRTSNYPFLTCEMILDVGEHKFGAAIFHMTATIPEAISCDREFLNHVQQQALEVVIDLIDDKIRGLA